MPFSTDFGICASGMPSNTPAKIETIKNDKKALILHTDIITTKAAMHNNTMISVIFLWVELLTFSQLLRFLNKNQQMAVNLRWEVRNYYLYPATESY